MREHAIPQDVTGYRFHIIGNMTLKQFAEVGAGCIVGVLIYSTNLPFLIKWPLIFLAVGIGAMAAFVPIEERPFDHWIVTFFKVLYKPTKFFWKRDSKLPDPFLYSPNQDTTNVTAEIDLKPARRQRIKEYLTSVQNVLDNPLYDPAELAKMQELMGMFSTVSTTTSTVKSMPQRPDLKVRVRPLRAPHELESTTIPLVSTTTPTTSSVPEPEEPLTYAPVNLSAQMTTAQVGQSIVIPEVAAINIEASAPVLQEEATIQATSLDERAYISAQDTVSISAPVATQQATLNAELPFPTAPNEPNKLVGMVLTPSNNLLNDTIVEITAADGQIVRAVKTNALGQFFITTPLANGTYTIAAEHDGYDFPLLQLTLTGTPVAPIEIRSQNNDPIVAVAPLPLPTAPTAGSPAVVYSAGQ